MGLTTPTPGSDGSCVRGRSSYVHVTYVTRGDLFSPLSDISYVDISCSIDIALANKCLDTIVMGIIQNPAREMGSSHRGK